MNVKKRNVLFIHDHPFQEIDGKYYTVDTLSNRLFEDYCNWLGNVKVIAQKAIPRNQYRPNEKDRLDIVETLLFPKHSFLTDRRMTLNCMEEEIRKADALVIRFPSFLGNIAVKYAQKYQKPYFAEIVGCAWDAFWNHSLKGKIIAPYMFWKTKKGVKGASHSVYVTEEFLQRRYPCDGEMSACSDVLLPSADREVLDRRLVALDGRKAPYVLGTIANLGVRYKGQQYVIQAMAKLKSQGIRLEYEMVGGGDAAYLRSCAEKLGVGDQVHFIGFLPHEEVFNWLDRLDIYIQPSLTEGMPRSVIEAMSRGCCCFGSHTGGIPELLPREMVFSPKDVDQLAAVLSKVNNELLRTQAKRNWEEAQKYDSEQLREKRSKIYRAFSESVGSKQ